MSGARYVPPRGHYSAPVAGTGGREIVSVEATLQHETAGAWLLEHDEDLPPVWVPKSLCRRGDEPDTWLMPEWLAEREGMI